MRIIANETYLTFAKKYGIDSEGKSFAELAELIYAHETEIENENSTILHKTLYYKPEYNMIEVKAEEDMTERELTIEKLKEFFDKLSFSRRIGGKQLDHLFDLVNELYD
jgi:hypothetical protein